MARLARIRSQRCRTAQTACAQYGQASGQQLIGDVIDAVVAQRLGQIGRDFVGIHEAHQQQAQAVFFRLCHELRQTLHIACGQFAPAFVAHGVHAQGFATRHQALEGIEGARSVIGRMNLHGAKSDQEFPDVVAAHRPGSLIPIARSLERNDGNFWAKPAVRGIASFRRRTCVDEENPG